MPRTLDVGASDGIDVTYMDTFRAHTGTDDPAVYFDYDIRKVAAPLTAAADDFAVYHDEIPRGTRFDEFGVGHVPAELFPLGGYLHPWQSFETVAEIDHYPFPSFEPSDALLPSIRALKDHGYAVSAASGSLNEWCFYLRSMERFLMDLLTEPDMARAALERVASLVASMAEQLADASVDILCFYGDSGDQRSMIMSPEVWRNWIKPYWRRIFAAARRVKPDVFVFLHSCGYIEPIIPDLVELGVDVLNPIQPEAMDPVALKLTYGRDLTLTGGVGMQTTMPSSSPDEVRRTVGNFGRVLVERGWRHRHGRPDPASRRAVAEPPGTARDGGGAQPSRARLVSRLASYSYRAAPAGANSSI